MTLLEAVQYLYAIPDEPGAAGAALDHLEGEGFDVEDMRGIPEPFGYNRDALIFWLLTRETWECAHGIATVPEYLRLSFDDNGIRVTFKCDRQSEYWYIISHDHIRKCTLEFVMSGMHRVVIDNVSKYNVQAMKRELARLPAYLWISATNYISVMNPAIYEMNIEELSSLYLQMRRVKQPLNDLIAKMLEPRLQKEIECLMTTKIGFGLFGSPPKNPPLTEFDKSWRHLLMKMPSPPRQPVFLMPPEI